MRSVAAAALVLTLAACGAPVSEMTTKVRHVPSNVPYGSEGARLPLFISDPSEPRPLETRKALARRSVSLEPGCKWVEAPDALLIEETRKQGERYADTMLVAPLRCSRV